MQPPTAFGSSMFGPLLPAECAWAWLRPNQRAFVPEILATWFNCEVADLGLSVGPHGQPLSQRGFYSVSHCQGLLGIAGSISGAVGLDVEHRCTISKAVQQRYFLPSEQAVMDGVELWCIKEAVVKAIGRGIAFGLRRIEITGDAASCQVHIDGMLISQWQVHRAQLDGGEAYALAHLGPVRRWTSVDLTLRCP